ncbi:4Fe-4S dicluster domain-containing protein [Sulfolobus acidocaldarius]|uniref:Conserved Archaeal 4Fe-4S binding domain protein n=4 Tax=Sulfolobus acidocaldarius TaxID=2285 RepID=Q4J731_SULAC|nr:4Fe-4S binding protein [Sulfolobus acidocaldarius]AAY81400.1 conserved Archaeal 4Fe-4S binding domain protein [Sulfolobus acidocaldarius DSM 639]AGE71999.1 4Fe-4S binding domain-containing protein [Sulfolobus acidocaldarius N8]AGE74315.1 4Fe-4S binding domain-containing protein [Sulfolobus acidocaldarius Ron12/I]ALU29807.1 (4Fe-4S)-binding protein [Sulfolobus acidocaldarius]ALU32546.1 (4Fe-4S)-binding protein [Sulfolobus acidocaldarius]
MIRLNVGLIVSKKAREILGDELLVSIFNDGEIAYVAEYGDFIEKDLKENSVNALVVVSESENRNIKDFLSNIDELTNIHPLSVEVLDINWLQSREQAKALILAYISKASLSFLARRVQPLRNKNLTRRSLLRRKLYYYKPYPVLAQEISFEREMKYLSSLCELVVKTPEGPQVSDPDKCTSCGFCSGMSFLGYLEMPNFSTDQVIAFINTLSKYAPTDKPGIVLITCNRITDIPKLKEAYIYPLISPCVSSVHDSFLTAILVSGFYPVLYSPDSSCELRDRAKIRAEVAIKRFPGTEIRFPYVEDLNELEDVLRNVASNSLMLTRNEIPQDIVLSRSRRRNLLLWSISQFRSQSKLNEEDEIPGVFKVVVDPDKCVLCGVCVRSCQMLVFDIKNTSSSTTLYHDLSYCIGSQRCVRNCPEGAITLVGSVKIKELGNRSVVSATIGKCKYCGKPLDSIKVKNRVSEILMSSGINDIEDYVDVCNDCKQKNMSKKWVEKTLGLSKK